MEPNDLDIAISGYIIGKKQKQWLLNMLHSEFKKFNDVTSDDKFWARGTTNARSVIEITLYKYIIVTMIEAVERFETEEK